MKNSPRWKMLMGFILLPMLSLSVFGMVYNMALKSIEPIPAAVYVFMILFGVLGIFWQ